MDWKPKEIVIELGGKQNQQCVFDPLGATLRGRWTRTNVMEVSSNTDFGRMPDIPGIHVGLDVKGQTLRAVDPLGWPENRETLRTANQIKKQHFGVSDPNATMTKRNMTLGDIKSALWEMREWLDADKAILRHGEMPSREEILTMPGDLRIRYGTLVMVDPVNKRYESPYATSDELQRLGAKPVSEVEISAPGATA